MLQKKVADLEVLEAPGDPDGLTIIMFHGYGADAYDLAGLSSAVQTEPRAKWIFPEGILSMAEIFSHPGYPGRAWWPIDQNALELAMSQGTFRDMSEHVPPNIQKLNKMGVDMIDALACDPSRLVIGGFSQGAMLATDLTLKLKSNPAGLVLLSGTLINQTKWKELAANRKGLTFFQSHGKNDPLLDYSKAVELNQLLVNAGLSGALMSFSGGHEIPESILMSLSKYLQNLLS